jgi:hypothetical protein
LIGVSGCYDPLQREWSYARRFQRFSSDKDAAMDIRFGSRAPAPAQ